MGTSYDVLYKDSLSKFKDFSLGDKTDEQIRMILHELIRPACVRFHVCRQNLSARDDIIEEFNITLTDAEIEILCSIMAVLYIDNNFIKTHRMMKTMLSSKDFLSMHQPEMLARMMDLYRLLKKDIEQMISIYSWVNNNGV